MNFYTIPETKTIVSLVIMIMVTTVTHGSSEEQKATPPGGLSFHHFTEETTQKNTGLYLLFLPEQYNHSKDTKWPLILFLHGSGERGTDLNLVKKHGPPHEATKQKNFPFIVLAPQCPSGKWWHDVDVMPAVMGMMEDVCSNYNVDHDRIYLTGLSMGGFGTWSIATQYPRRFAAIAPVCGGGNPYLADRLKKLPVRIYHGEKDKNVPHAMSQQMYNVLKQIKGNVELVTLKDMGHNVWSRVYSDPDFYQWLLRHRRKTATEDKAKK